MCRRSLTVLASSPVSSSIAATITSNSRPGGVRNASPEMRERTMGSGRLALGDLLDHADQIGAALKIVEADVELRRCDSGNDVARIGRSRNGGEFEV